MNLAVHTALIAATMSHASSNHKHDYVVMLWDKIVAIGLCFCVSIMIISFFIYLHEKLEFHKKNCKEEYQRKRNNGEFNHQYIKYRKEKSKREKHGHDL